MVTTLFVLALTGCAPGPIAAPYGSSLVMPSDVDFSFDQAYSEAGDLTGGLFYTYIGVMGPDDMPLNGIQVEITSGWTGAYLISERAVRVVDEYETECTENPPEDPEDPCHAWFDVEDQKFVEFAGDYSELGGFGPTYMSAVTNNRGLLPVYVFVDSVPVDSEGSAVAVPIFASIGIETQSFQLTAAL
jgi:hypothetical protein